MATSVFQGSPEPKQIETDSSLEYHKQHQAFKLGQHEVRINESAPFVGSPEAYPGGEDVDAIIPDGTGLEICSSKRIGVLWSFLFFHLPSIAISIVLFVLHMIGLSWAKDPTADQLSALQFPAKAHEILIVMSLTEILLHRIKYGMLGQTGIALGFVTAPFQVANPLYLISPDFWGTVRIPQRNRRFHNITIGLLVVLVIVGVLVGPFSAILMIPRQDWVETSPDDGWYVDHISRRGENEIFYITQDPYPKVLDQAYASGVTGVCLEQATNVNATCDNDIQLFINEYLALNEVAHGGNRAQYNITVSRDGISTPYRPLSTDLLSNAGFATGPMDFVAYDLAQYEVSNTADRDILFIAKPQSHGSTKIKKWKQPLVATSCTEGYYISKDDSMRFTWDDELLQNHTLVMSVSDMSERMFALDMPDVLNSKSFSIDVRDDVPLPVSASLLFFSRKISEIQEGDAEDLENTWMQMCHVVARWHEADVWADTRLPTGAQSELGIHPNKTFETMKKSSSRTANITMTDEWLSLIGPSWNETHYNIDYATLHQASINSEGGSYMLSKLLALYLADAVTMSSPFESANRETVDFEALPDDVVIELVIDTTAWSHLYTYSMSNSRSRPLAFALLFFQASIAIAHHLIIAFARKPWHSSSWGSQEELIALALRSKSPPGIHSLDDIVTNLSAKKLPIGIRETHNDKRLEMVVLNSEGTNAEATGGRALGHGVVKRVRTGIKYV
jgi:hypothetical protein